MNRILLVAVYVILATTFCKAQNVFDPNDPIIRIDLNRPLGSPEHPDESIPGLQKWVSTPNNAVSTGYGAFDASSYKQYFINLNGAKVPFRLKFPKSYNNPDSASKHYPVNVFLHGGIEVGCPTNGGIYNNEKHLWIGAELFRDWADEGKFDGFILFPQYTISSKGCFAAWATAPSGNLAAVIAIIDSLSKYSRADIDRVIIDGLSGGGYGAWRMADAYPQRVAKIMPSAAAGSVTNRARFVHIPIWFATGGKDPDPSPAQAQYTLTKMRESGANIKYSLFPDRGHSVWFQHWAEPGFVEEWSTAHKANPLVFFQRTEFCKEEDVDAKLGLTPGFYAYEWQRNGVTIALSTNGNNQVLDTGSVSTFTGNEITISKFGTYRARFKRKASANWSDWSTQPAVIGAMSTTQTQPIRVDGRHSNVLPALDGSSTVPLTLASGFTNYQWYRVSDESLVATTQVYHAPPGVYRGRYEERYGCGTQFSPDFIVVDANGTPKPDAATELTAVPQSERSVQLKWVSGNNQNGFEVYRSTAAGGPYVFIDLVAGNANTYTDTGLAKNTLYVYRVRAVSTTGAAAGSNEAAAKTLTDNQPPTPPSALAYQINAANDVTLTWKPATDNNAVVRYDIYVNGRKMYTAYKSGFVVSHLDSIAPYTFAVRAVDAAENVSEPSNQVTYLPDGAVAGNLPGVPSNVAAAATAYDRISITWEDTISNETGFELVRSRSFNGSYVPVATVDANRTGYVDAGLNAGASYYYRLRAINQNGESAFSATVDSRTPAAPGTPEAPQQLHGESAANGSISLTWEDHSANETGYEVYRSTDSVTFTKIATLPANSNAYTNSDAIDLTTYYYYVVGTNNAGSGSKSNILTVRAGNKAPVINGLRDVLVKATTSIDIPFTVTDDAGDEITVSLPGDPGFVSLNRVNGNYLLKISPDRDKAGTYQAVVSAKDNYNKQVFDTVSIFVGDPATRSILVSFGNNSVQAVNTWNTWPNVPADGAILTNLRDESNAATSISITAVSAWDSITTMGHITGNNSGILPDQVMKNGWMDTSNINDLIISGLDPVKQYNLVFIASQNEGVNAEAAYTSGSQTARLNARYNTNQAATLSSLIPVNGQISVRISRVGASPLMYLNGLVIEEYAQSVAMLSPDHLYGEALDKSSVRLTWTDRTNKEAESDGYELGRATDSLFSKNVHWITLPANSVAYTDTNLNADTEYWYAVRAKNGPDHSAFSRRIHVTTPASIVYVNFNVTVADAPAPWNNLKALPLSSFTASNLKNQSGEVTSLALTLEKVFEGEFTGGVNTGNNSGVVPDNALLSSYWLASEQLSQFRLSGLNHGSRYRVGFFGSSSPREWIKGNYTAKYSVHERSVYLNSWENSTKVVYIDDITPDADGKLMLDFTTTPEASNGFNSGVIIQQYSFKPADTLVDRNLPDTVINPNPPDTTTNPNNPPDTTGNPNNPPDTTGNPNNPPDTTGNPNPPVPQDTVSEDRLVAYPNPFVGEIRFLFNNRDANDNLTLEIYDSYGRITYRQNIGKRPRGNNVVVVNTLSANLRNGVYIAALKANGKVYQSVKIVRRRY
jgi:fibronectin type 3 domain-containing protein